MGVQGKYINGLMDSTTSVTMSHSPYLICLQFQLGRVTASSVTVVTASRHIFVATVREIVAI